MNKAVLLLSSLALLLGGCSEKGDSTTSQMDRGQMDTGQMEETTTVDEVVESGPAAMEEMEVTTESAEPATSDMAPAGSDEEMGMGGDAGDQEEDAPKGTDPATGE